MPKQKHGPVPQYITRSMVDRQEDHEWSWLTAPERAQRVYDSSLSTPGRICRTPYCLEFVAGGFDRPCPRCGAIE